MTFKLEKLKLDLELNLTAYIPGEAGTINAVRTSPDDLLEWMKHGADVGQEAISGKDVEGKKGGEQLELRQKQLITQIDFLYEKGEGYWKAIPFTLLTQILEYIREQVENTEKKS